jgi:hypothetical protein
MAILQVDINNTAPDGTSTFNSIQAAIDASDPGDTITVADGVYNETVTLRSGITLTGNSQADVIINGSMVTPASLADITVTNFTVHNATTGDYLLDMRATALAGGSFTDVVFEHVTFELVSNFVPTGAGTFPNDSPIGTGFARGSIELIDGGDADNAGLTFRHVTMASGDFDIPDTLALIFIDSGTGGARMVLDDLTITGMDGASNLGAQFNMSPNAGETAHVEIINSHTSGGGNFYVSGMASVLVEDNVFDGQGLALNGVSNATVTGNTFQNIDGSITAGGGQHRGLVIEDAWGTAGVSNVTVTGNIFNNITAVDGAIAFQRFTSPPSDLATIERLNDITISGNTFTGLGVGVNPI